MLRRGVVGRHVSSGRQAAIPSIPGMWERGGGGWRGSRKSDRIGPEAAAGDAARRSGSLLGRGKEKGVLGFWGAARMAGGGRGG